MPALSRANRKVASGESQFVPVPRLSSETSFEPIAEGVTNRMSDPYRRCPHCRGTGICQLCKGTGRLALQKGKQCTSCFPHGSGKCQNCRGFGGFNAKGEPAERPA